MSLRRALLVLTLLAAAALVAGCNRSSPPARVAGSGPARLTGGSAGELLGGLASQLAGDRASVQSIIVNPSTDPHSYQPSARDARTIAGAEMVIVNGAGYDE